MPKIGYSNLERRYDKPVRSKIPDKTIKGNREGIILVHQVKSPDITRVELVTGSVNSKKINRILVSKGR